MLETPCKKRIKRAIEMTGRKKAIVRQCMKLQVRVLYKKLIMEVQHQNHNESAYYVENQDTIERIVLAKGNDREEN
jgi:hypothetical protein